MVSTTSVFAHIWVLVDTNNAQLMVKNNDETVFVIDDIAIGRAGPTDLHLLNDNKTPLGEFRISRINTNSRFELFFEFNYPTIEHAEIAFDRGIIDTYLLDKIRISQYQHKVAPTDTILGGHLGIHGIGNGSLEMHQKFNWTNGCIAVTNREIRQLSHWVRLGTKVVVQ